MIDRRARIELAELIAATANAASGSEIGSQESLIAFVAEACSIEPAAAEALAWGADYDFENDTLDKISSTFALHRDLLACILCPTSDEILDHVLGEIADVELDRSCSFCCELAEEISDFDSYGFDEQAEICIDLLVHLSEASFAASEAPAARQPLSGIGPDLVRVVDQLDPAAQARVLAYAYGELGGGLNDPRPQLSSAYGHLRQQYLTPLARRVFDLLASAGDGQLSSLELVEALGLSDARSLGQLPRSVQRALRDLRRDGHYLDEPPLVVRRHGERRIYSLSDSALEAWRAFLRAERSPLLAD